MFSIICNYNVKCKNKKNVKNCPTKFAEIEYNPNVKMRNCRAITNALIKIRPYNSEYQIMKPNLDTKYYYKNILCSLLLD